MTTLYICKIFQVSAIFRSDDTLLHRNVTLCVETGQTLYYRHNIYFDKNLMHKKFEKNKNYNA